MNQPFYNYGAQIGLPMSVFATGAPIKVLLIDDDRDEASLTRSLLARVTDIDYAMDWVPTFDEGLDAIARNEHDAFLIDHRLGARTGVELVRQARKAGSLAALIMLTGQRDRSTDIAAMDAGATEFLAKGRTDAALLDRSLRYSITQAAMTTALERSRSQMAGLERIGRLLEDDGPTPATIERIVDLVEDHFGFHHVAIYLSEGDETLVLRGQRGHVEPLTSLSTADSSVVRVARAGAPVFVPSVNAQSGVVAADAKVATELSVPLIVGGALVGLLNVGSLVSDPMGRDDYAAVRLLGDRMTAALELVRERRMGQERLSAARRDARGRKRSATGGTLLDPDTGAFDRAMLEPLLQVAIGTAGNGISGPLGLLLVACGSPIARAMRQLGGQIKAVYPDSPVVRLSDSTIGVLCAGTEQVAVRAGAAELASQAKRAGLDVWCGYGALAPGWHAAELVEAAEVALAYAQRAAPGTVIG